MRASRKHPWRKVSSEKGVAYVEMSLSFGMFLLLILILMELLIISYRYAALQYFLSASLRNLSLNIDPPPPAPVTDLATVKANISNYSAAYSIRLLPADIIVKARSIGVFPPNTACDPADQSVGDPGHFLSVCIQKEYSFVFGLVPVTLRARGFAKREPTQG